MSHVVRWGLHDIDAQLPAWFQNQLYVIKQPEVFKLSVDTYIVFGAAMIEDLNAKAQSAAAEQFKQPEGPQKGFSGSIKGCTYEVRHAYAHGHMRAHADACARTCTHTDAHASYMHMHARTRELAPCSLLKRSRTFDDCRSGRAAA